jgi:hypothetical protein
VIRHTKDEVDAAVEYARRWFVETKSPMSVLTAEVLALREELAQAEAQALAADTHSVNVKAEYEEHRRRLDALQRPPRYSTELVDALVIGLEHFKTADNFGERVEAGKAVYDALAAVRASREPPR